MKRRDFVGGMVAAVGALLGAVRPVRPEISIREPRLEIEKKLDAMCSTAADALWHPGEPRAPILVHPSDLEKMFGKPTGGGQFTYYYTSPFGETQLIPSTLVAPLEPRYARISGFAASIRGVR